MLTHKMSLLPLKMLLLVHASKLLTHECALFDGDKRLFAGNLLSLIHMAFSRIPKAGEATIKRD